MKIASIGDFGRMIEEMCRLRKTSAWALGQYSDLSNSTFLRIMRDNGQDFLTNVLFEFARITECEITVIVPEEQQRDGLTLPGMTIHSHDDLNVCIAVLLGYRQATMADVRRATGVFPAAFQRKSTPSPYRFNAGLLKVLTFLGAELHIAPLTKQAIRRKLQVSGSRINK